MYTREQIQSMEPGWELDEAAAIVVMGREDNKTVWGQKPFEPSHNIAAAMELEAKAIEKTGTRYLWKLDLIVNDGKAWEWNDDDILNILRATPEQRTKAAILAMMEVNE